MSSVDNGNGRGKGTLDAIVSQSMPEDNDNVSQESNNVLKKAAAYVGCLMAESTSGAKNIAQEVRAYATSVPKLLYRLARSPDVPFSSKVEILAALAYIAIPPDVIPDFIPALGWLDDFVVAAGVIANVVAKTDKETVLKYWDGPPESFEKIYNLAGRAYGAIKPIKPFGGKIAKRFYHLAQSIITPNSR